MSMFPIPEGLERFRDHAGVEKIRLTPAGARAIGQEQLALWLEACKAGNHVFVPDCSVRWCVCEETKR